jgi:hypothetical protein
MHFAHEACLLFRLVFRAKDYYFRTLTSFCNGDVVFLGEQSVHKKQTCCLSNFTLFLLLEVVRLQQRSLLFRHVVLKKPRFTQPVPIDN